MKIAVEGCAHGELENIYNTLSALEEQEKIKIDLLICCGDFQSSRSHEDLKCMAVPPKYAHICTFYKYYSGEKIAPVLTIFIGGNHEASNYLQELPYGGWVAPNIYYLGYAGVINIAGVRIAGLSGIYKSQDYLKGHFEKCPYDESTKRSVYHVRNLEVFRLKQLSGVVDIFLSHDWPSNVYKYGNLKQLLKRKPHFRGDVENNQLGSKACEELLHHIKPAFWFAAHLHCKYAALVNHDNGSMTKFLALDKCLPKRKFLQIVDIPHDKDAKIEINHDLEWLAILYATNHLLSVKNNMTFMPGPGGTERYNFTPSDEEKKFILERLQGDLVVPKNFSRTIPAYQGQQQQNSQKKGQTRLEPKLNPQTVTLCEKLSISDPIQLISQNLNIKLDVGIDESWQDISLVNNDSSIVEEESEATTNSVGAIKRIGSLSLPNPKMDFTVDILEDTIEKPKDVSLELEKVERARVDDEEEEDEVAPVESPTPRKLKRRNMEFYQCGE